MRERSELILLAVCLEIWFSLIFQSLSLVVVTDAVSGLTMAIFTFAPQPPSFPACILVYEQNKRICKSLTQFTKSSNAFACEPILCSDIAQERHTTAVPAPNKWPTLHINTHLHEQNPGQLYSFCCQSQHFVLVEPLAWFLDIATLFKNRPVMLEEITQKAKLTGDT